MWKHPVSFRLFLRLIWHIEAQTLNWGEQKSFLAGGALQILFRKCKYLFKNVLQFTAVR